MQAVCDFFGPADFTAVMRHAADDPNVRNIFAFNTPSDPYSSLIGAKLGEDREKTDAVSPVHYVSSDNPPFLIVHGTRDALVPFAQSEALAAALEAKALLQTIPGGGHGGPGFNKPAINGLIQSFFDRHLQGQPVPVEPVPEADVTVPVKPNPAK